MIDDRKALLLTVGKDDMVVPKQEHIGIVAEEASVQLTAEYGIEH